MVQQASNITIGTNENAATTNSNCLHLHSYHSQATCSIWNSLSGMTHLHADMCQHSARTKSIPCHRPEQTLHGLICSCCPWLEDSCCKLTRKVWENQHFARANVPPSPNHVWRKSGATTGPFPVHHFICSVSLEFNVTVSPPQKCVGMHGH